MRIDTLARALSLSILSAVLVHGASAQCGEWSPDFVLPGLNAPPEAMTVFDDGSGPALYAAGTFTIAGGKPVTRVARWDGTEWHALGSIPIVPHSLVVFDDGSGPALYADGRRWNGSSWVTVGGGISGTVNAQTVFDDGTGPGLYVSGVFTVAGGTISHIARWDGASWSPLGAGVLSSAGATCVHDDGSGPALYVAAIHNGSPLLTRVSRWNGSSWSDVGVGGAGGAGGAAGRFFSYDDGSGSALYAAGNFDEFDGVAASNVVRWDGSGWGPVGGGLDDVVIGLHAFDDGTGTALYAGTFSGTEQVQLQRWDGDTWSSLSDVFTLPSASAWLGGMVTFDAGTGPQLVVGGAFRHATGKGANNIASWDGTTWSVLGAGQGLGSYGAVPTIRAGVVFDDGTGPALYVAGSFQSAGGSAARGVARWDGTVWSALGPGIPGNVSTLAVFDDGDGPALYAGGSFTSAGTESANSVARWKDGVWSRLDEGIDGEVNTLCVFDDGTGSALYAGGWMNQAGLVLARGVARWDGESWSAAGGDEFPFGTNVSALAVFDDGSGAALYAGSNAFGNGVTTVRSLARWTGTQWTTVDGGTDDPGIRSLQVFDDGTGPALYCAGDFHSVGGGVPAKYLARWGESGWSAVATIANGQPGNISTVLGLSVFDDGSGPALYVGGIFQSVDGVPAKRVARWNGTTWSALAGGLNMLGLDTVIGFAAFEDGSDGAPDLYVLGHFAPIPGVMPVESGWGVARWDGCAPGASVCLGDGTGAACPCANYGLPGHGCRNSATIRGALLEATGLASLDYDTLALTSTFEPPNVTSIFLQGSQLVAPVVFGDGLRCAGGALKRLYVKNASGDGTVSAPAVGASSISARALELGDTLEAGSSRVYQVYYRDPSLTHCPEPAGSTFNVSNGMQIYWLP